MKTLAELEKEFPSDFKNPFQTDAEYDALRARSKAKHDKEMITCPIDTDTEEEDVE